jgi:ligand-binding sensor domain-containing protein/signal transduction histidine kinase
MWMKTPDEGGQTVARVFLNCLRFLLVLLASAAVDVRGAPTQFLPQDSTVRIWNREQGLPDNSVTAVLQTRDGYLWIGTLGGLARFDGVRFVPVTPVPGRTNEVIRVTSLCEDSLGGLWVGTQGTGLWRCSEGGLSRFRLGGDPLDDTINSITEDTAGNLWLGTPSGLDLLSRVRLKRFTTKDGLPNNFVSNVHVARSGTVWITTRGGMCQFKEGKLEPVPFQTDSPGRSPESLGVYEDRATNLWAYGDTYLVNLSDGKHLNLFSSGDEIASTRIFCLCEGRHGELWIGTSGKGLYCFVDERFVSINPRNGGLAGDVRSLCEDREGNLWLGTYGSGLVRLQSRNVNLLDLRAGLPNHPPSCLALNAQGHAWIGFEQAGLYSGNGERFDRYSGLPLADFQDLVSSLAVGPESSLWIGTPGAGLYCLRNQRVIHYRTANGLADDTILSVAVDDAGTVWAGTLGGWLNRIEKGKITRLGVSSGLRGQAITAILPTHHGGLWLGFEDGGVAHGEVGKFAAMIEPAALEGKAIRALHEDSNGRIWLGTAGGELACVVANTFLKWDLKLGGSEAAICGILDDDDGDLWLSTGRSIFQAGRPELAAALSTQAVLQPQLVYEEENAVNAAPTYGWPRAAKAADGTLWFGMANGMVTLDPRRFATDLAALPVLIESVVVNGDTQPYAQTRDLVARTNDAAALRLPSRMRSLEIQFTTLSFSAPEKIRFRHRLDGFESDWVEGGANRKEDYGKLPYGRYTFRVQAGNSGEWLGQPTTLSFLIPTPLWRTDWALAGYGLLAAALVAGGARLAFNRRLRLRLAVLATQQATERERMRIAKDMHDEIGSKLTKISFMSERAKGELEGQDAVATKLDSIALTSRDLLQSLDEIVWAVNPQNDTLEHLAAYLGHYTTEYLQNTAVESELHIPQNLPHHPLSAETRHNLFLAFEETLNNSLKHGRASRIRVDMQTGHAGFEIKVQDNGCGFDAEAVVLANRNGNSAPEKRGGNGLRNMQQRLADVGGQCRIESRRGQGTVVTLSVSLRPAAVTTRNKQP